MLDTACLMKAFKEAVKLIDQYPSISVAEPKIKNIRVMLQNEKSVNDATFLKILNSTVRPKSLVICLDDKLKFEERAIRTLMLRMGISRKKALEYKNAAINLYGK